MNTVREITYLSAPGQVSMADRWYEIASGEHFWIQRRFKVLERLAGDLLSGAQAIAEIGCGNGLLQRQVEDRYRKEVAGFDLNEAALKINVSRLSAVHCYDIYEKHPSLSHRFDIIFLFDVLEHISDEKSFLEALLFHLAPGGHIILNVPAGQWAFSAYDEAAGHVRRYSIATLRRAMASVNLDVVKWTYWGLPLVPVLALRKLWLLGRRNKGEIIDAGFAIGNRFVNELMGLLCRCEPIPQQLVGSSLMAVLRVEFRD